MRTFDLSPLFRSTVGFDRMSRFLDTALQADEASAGYPPYNIEKTGETAYRVTMAVAGFSIDDLEITATENMVVVKGNREREQTGEFLYRGIATRSFERRFQLADYLKVTGARMDNGLLHIELAREVPEELKPRTVAIEADTGPARIERKAA